VCAPIFEDDLREVVSKDGAGTSEDADMVVAGGAVWGAGLF
jgi:hypothetical protein